MVFRDIWTDGQTARVLPRQFEERDGRGWISGSMISGVGFEEPPAGAE